jgi:predicted  nucleic acid-binding Zn-ribbon protein
MKTFPLFPAALVCSALVGQTSTNLVEVFNREAPAINKLMGELRPEDALAKAESLIPAQKPVFDNTSLNSISQSSTNFRGLSAIYKACGNAAAASGDWAKGLEYYEKALAVSKEGRDTFKLQAVSQAEGALEKIKAGLAITREQWDKLRPELIARDAEYTKMKTDLEANAKRTKEQDGKLKQLQEVLPQIQNDIKANDQKIKQFEAAVVQNQGALNVVQDMVKELDQAVAKAESDVKGMAEKIEGQKTEIETFNAGLLKKNKRAKILGNKNWADAVMAGKANFTDKNPQEQSNLLRRLLVLDPGNKAATKALENVKQGRDPFFVEKAGSKSKKAPK